jgi:hypothetical protein
VREIEKNRKENMKGRIKTGGENKSVTAQTRGKGEHPAALAYCSRLLGYVRDIAYLRRELLLVV